MYLEKKLEFWLKNNCNVLLRGRHGCGKTAMIKQTFEQAGLKWMYFSCSTMDPWVDFIGVPKEVKDGDKSYLDLVRPKVFQEDEVEALFFDEFNRAPKKVRNAVMELIQFKSINGKKFSNLKVVWAAINPSSEDEAYDVEELDPAQIDRFQVNIEVPCVPHGPYFKNKYGQDWAEAAITWWRELDANVRKAISPRRLDYALEMFKMGGDMKDVLPPNANISKLLVELVHGPITKKLKQLFEDNNIADSKKFLAVENNYAACINVIIKSKDYMKFFIPTLTDEKISSLIVKHKIVEDFMFNDFEQFEPLLQQIVKAGNKRIAARVNSTQESLRRQKLLTGNLNNISFKRHYNINANSAKFDRILKTLSFASSGTQDRKQNYLVLNDLLPQKLTPTQVELCLSIVNDIVCHSHKQTLSHYTNLIGILNHILACHIENGGVPTLPKRVTEILTGYPTFLLNIASKQALASSPTPIT